MQRRRGSPCLSWKPHFGTVGDGVSPFVGLPIGPIVEGMEVEDDDGVMGTLGVKGTMGDSYAISVGTLSEVMPFPPGQLGKVQLVLCSDPDEARTYVFITSTSSGLEV
jgi:hypothetical protein